MREPMTDEEFVRSGGNLCPFCWSENISCEGHMYENGQKTVCEECGKVWYELYKLIGWEGIDK